MATDHSLDAHWDEMSDEDLFLHAKEHPEQLAQHQAYFHLVQRHERSLYRHIIRALRDDPAQEDLAEKFFMQAWDQLYSSTDPSIGHSQSSVRGKVFALADVILLTHFMQDAQPELPVKGTLGDPQSAPPPDDLPHAGRRGHSTH